MQFINIRQWTTESYTCKTHQAEDIKTTTVTTYQYNNCPPLQHLGLLVSQHSTTM